MTADGKEWKPTELVIIDTEIRNVVRGVRPPNNIAFTRILVAILPVEQLPMRMSRDPVVADGISSPTFHRRRGTRTDESPYWIVPRTHTRPSSRIHLRNSC